MVEEALNQAKAGRLHIMDEMNKTIAEPNVDYKPNAPRIVTLVIDKDFIGAVIGPGGKIIQGMQRDTGATISITEENNTGIVEVASNNKESLDKALAMIRAIVAIPEVGTEYVGKVKSIVDFGAFVEIMPGKDGLLHISEIGWSRLATMDGVFQVGEEIKVKLIEVDQKTGKLKLSRKVLLPKPEGYVEPAPRENRPPRDDRGPRGDNRGPRDGGRRDDRGPRPPREPRPENNPQ
jgi:polyribonucleotide nucleotidyltransferase